jgi:hypothetical protein
VLALTIAERASRCPTARSRSGLRCRAAGFAVGPAGDVTDDDTDDLMVGARLNDAGGLDAGAVYVLFGVPEACGKGHEKNDDKPGHGGNHACDAEP